MMDINKILKIRQFKAIEIEEKNGEILISGELKNTEKHCPKWLIFFLRTMQKHKIRLEYKIGTDAAKMTELPVLSVKIMGLAETQDRLTISEVVEKIGANINTVKKHLAELVSKGYLVKYGKSFHEFTSLFFFKLNYYSFIF